METIEKKPRKPRTVTKPYQKHKEGYTIAVEHKMRVNLHNHLLYVEVRAKGQTTTFKSRFTFICYSETAFDLALKNSVVIKCIQYEKKIIEESIKQTVEMKGKEFSIVDWLRLYRQENGPNLRLVAERYLQSQIINNHDSDNTKAMFSEIRGFQFLIKFVAILKELGVEGTEKITDLASICNRFLYFKEIELSFPDEYFCKKNFYWNLFLNDDYCYRDISTGFFKEMAVLSQNIVQSEATGEVSMPSNVTEQELQTLFEAIDSIPANRPLVEAIYSEHIRKLSKFNSDFFE